MASVAFVGVLCVLYAQCARSDNIESSAKATLFVLAVGDVVVVLEMDDERSSEIDRSVELGVVR
jgi:hypothetical protein